MSIMAVVNTVTSPLSRLLLPFGSSAAAFCSSIGTPPIVTPHTSLKFERCLLCTKTRFRKVMCVVGSRWTESSSSFETFNEGVWEDPDDGSGSDFSDNEDDDDDEEYDGKEWVENDFDYESDWEQNGRVVVAQTGGASALTVDQSVGDSYDDDIAKEVDQLLEPEERAILQQNTTLNLEKISTAKWKPLQTLSLAGQIRFMDKLLDEGVHIDSVDKDGLTALHRAIIGKKEAVISHLLRKGASPHVRDRDGATPLHYAAQVGALQTVKLLIKYKVDVNMEDNEGWTPLHIAIQTRNRDIAKVLLVNGADKTRRNKDGRTALDLCLCYGKDFKSYDLAKLVKIVPAGREL